MMETKSANKKTRRSGLIVCCHTTVVFISSFKGIYYEKKTEAERRFGEASVF
jgi:hypothetical protein